MNGASSRRGISLSRFRTKAVTFPSMRPRVALSFNTT